MNGVLNTNSYISLGIALAIISGVVWINVNVAKLQTTAEMNKEELASIQARLRATELSRESWGYQDMYRWASHLQRDNPSLKVPEPQYEK